MPTAIKAAVVNWACVIRLAVIPAMEMLGAVTRMFTKRFARTAEEAVQPVRPSTKQIASAAGVGCQDVHSIHRLLTR
jgi:hypothetical protein